MREIDAHAPVPVDVLIGRAGAAVARVALEMLGGAYGRRVHVLAGPGNNGADGRVAADRLRERGVAVTVHDALDPPTGLPPCDLVIDAAFGTGFRDRWAPPEVGDAAVLAVDVPTGLDAGRGTAIRGTIAADRTVTFGAAKPGHLFGDGPRVVGRLDIVDIGLGVDPPTVASDAGIVERGDVAAWLPTRGRDAHKWTTAVRIVAGSSGMTGAAWLAAAGAQRAGAGIVVASCPGIDAALPIEVVGRVIPPFDWTDDLMVDLHRFSSLVIGPGLGRAEYAIPSIVAAIESSTVPTVIDGDGLFAMSWNEHGAPIDLRDREVAFVLTPHDGEYLQLLGVAPDPDRIVAARRLVDATGAVVLLKGPNTVVASPDGPAMVVTNGDQRLATAGSGDVLAGVLAALLAAGLDPARAAAAAAWLHAGAADRAGEGLVAGDLPTQLPAVVSDLIGTAG